MITKYLLPMLPKQWFASFLYELILITALIIRRQFEQANLEAMDESAEWRMKYDVEFSKNRQLQDGLRN
jgi:hypothetical protein